MSDSNHPHLAGVSNFGQGYSFTRPTVYDFGWGSARRQAFSIGSSVCMMLAFVTLAIGIFLADNRLFILTAILLYLYTQLLMGFVGMWLLDPGVELVLPYVDFLRSDSDRILDAGCGSGRATIAVGKIMKNGRITAVDRFDSGAIANGGRTLLERNLEIAKIADRVDIRAQDITALVFEDGIFDAAVSAYGMDRLGDDEKLKGLKEINRVLKKDGRLLLMGVVRSPGMHGIHRALYNMISGSKPASAESWGRLFEEARFTCVSDGDINNGHYFLLEKAV